MTVIQEYSNFRKLPPEVLEIIKNSMVKPVELTIKDCKTYIPPVKENKCVFCGKVTVKIGFCSKECITNYMKR